MAKALLGNLVLDVRGKLAGSVWRRSRHGHTVRAAGHQVAAPTAAQVDQRTAFGACKILWSTLTPSELDLWRALAPRPLTGWMFQLQTNLPRARANAPLARTPTPDPTPSGAPARGWHLLAELANVAAPTIEFADIDQDFEHVQIYLTGNTTSANESGLTLTTTPAARDAWQYLLARGNLIVANGEPGPRLGRLSSAGQAPSNCTIFIPNYSTARAHMLTAISTSARATVPDAQLITETVQITTQAPVTSITLTPVFGTFTNTTAQLWGLAK